MPHITGESISKNTEIDTIHDEMHPLVVDSLAALNNSLKGHAISFEVESGSRAGRQIQFDLVDGIGTTLPSGELAPENAFLEWEVPFEPPEHWPRQAKIEHQNFWKSLKAKRKRIDDSITKNAEFETLYNEPLKDNSTVRVSGPFTVESLSPHRIIPVDDHDQNEEIAAKARQVKLNANHLRK